MFNIEQIMQDAMEKNPQLKELVNEFEKQHGVKVVDLSKEAQALFTNFSQPSQMNPFEQLFNHMNDLSQSSDKESVKQSQPTDEIDAEIQRLQKLKEDMLKQSEGQKKKETQVRVNQLKERHSKVKGLIVEVQKLAEHKKYELVAVLRDKALSQNILRQIHLLHDKENSYQEELKTLEHEISLFK